MQQKIEEITTMQMLMSSTGSLSPQELIVAALHSLNTQHQLKCIDNKNQECQFPVAWNQQGDGCYSFKYKNKARSTVVSFKYTIEGKNVVGVFSEEGTSETYRVTVKSTESLENIIKNYVFTLKQYLAKEGKIQPKYQKYQNGNIDTAPQNQISGGITSTTIKSNYPPKNLINQGNFQNPFGNEEYVGPDSSIFTQPYSQPTQVSSPLYIPPGARYDPVDPFDNPLIDKKGFTSPDPMGFDQFGVPIRKPFPPPRSGFPGNNPFQGGFRGGFGGGLGGGGFGGLI